MAEYLTRDFKLDIARRPGDEQRVARRDPGKWMEYHGPESLEDRLLAEAMAWVEEYGGVTRDGLVRGEPKILTSGFACFKLGKRKCWQPGNLRTGSCGIFRGRGETRRGEVMNVFEVFDGREVTIHGTRRNPSAVSQNLSPGDWVGINRRGRKWRPQ